MDSLTFYREIIKDLITEYGQEDPGIGDIEVETIFNEENDHYALVYTGWDGHHRIHGDVLHIDIRGGKIWIQHDGTYIGVAKRMVERGVPKDKIVLGYKSPSMRELTGYAVG